MAREKSHVRLYLAGDGGMVENYGKRRRVVGPLLSVCRHRKISF